MGWGESSLSRGKGMWKEVGSVEYWRAIDTSASHGIKCRRQPRSHAEEVSTYPKSSKALGTASDQERHMVPAQMPLESGMESGQSRGVQWSQDHVGGHGLMGPPCQEDPDQSKLANFLCLRCLIVKQK